MYYKVRRPVELEEGGGGERRVSAWTWDLGEKEAAQRQDETRKDEIILLDWICSSCN